MERRRPKKQKPAGAGHFAHSNTSDADRALNRAGSQAGHPNGADLVAAIRAEHEAAQHCAAQAVAHAIRVGELLQQAKDSLAHGEFGAWLAANVEFSDRTARGYMRLAGLDAANRQRVADMSLRAALQSLAEPRAIAADFEPPRCLPADDCAVMREAGDTIAVLIPSAVHPGYFDLLTVTDCELIVTRKPMAWRAVGTFLRGAGLPDDDEWRPADVAAARDLCEWARGIAP
jgi:hypothetical protein